MYEIHFRRWYDKPTDFALTGRADTIADALKLRLVSGELVVHAGTTSIVCDPGWLFDWEKKDQDCYAREATRWELAQRAAAVVIA